MEQAATVPLVQQNANASSTPEQTAETPEQAAERIRALLLDDESDPWELGDLLNTIAKRDLARKAGYRSTRAWLFAKVPEAEAKDAALYRCAHVASLFSKEQAKLWGVIKLDALATHDYDTRRPPDSEDPAEREIQLLQADGSTLTKKFRDCSCRELQLSNQLRRKAARDQRQAATPRPKKEAPAARSRPEIEVRSSRKPLAVLALGILMICTFAFLPASRLATAVLVYGIGFLLTGIAILAWRGARSVERLSGAAPKERP